ncbi:MAG: hypothetical protein J6J61_06920 [Muribaculaceae bacterium]|nr:hypothetical protein [Muribaculaceae bacterium]MBP3638972.1 hypothetical protein [Muribaculaceae bacterium]
MRRGISNPWLKAAVVVTLLPLAAWPTLIGRAAEPSWMLWAYPAVIAFYAYAALACARERIALAWVLAAMSLLTSIAIWML